MDAPFKKILSIGGWAESTNPSTFRRYREAVKPGNRQKVASNVAAFVKENGLDGVDIDWEYPGAPNIPGIPPGREDEGLNYLLLLTWLNLELNGKSLSIALPASFWYLRPFHVSLIEPYLNYFVYMTYDLYG